MKRLRHLLWIASLLPLGAGCSPKPLRSPGGGSPSAQPRPVAPGPSGEAGSKSENTAPGSSAPSPAVAGLEEAARLHLRGVEGDDAAAETALGMLSSLADDSPDEPLVLAYLGSAKVLAAKRQLLPWKKGTTCREGLELLDRAVSLAPDNELVRFLRAISTRPLPAFFEREEQSAADFAWVAARCRRAEGALPVSGAIAASALLHDGYCRAARSDTLGARSAWEAAIRVGPDTEPARLAARELENLVASTQSGK